METNLDDPTLAKLMFAILVKRLGGHVKITQADIDAVSYHELLETGYSDGSVEFMFESDGEAQQVAVPQEPIAWANAKDLARVKGNSNVSVNLSSSRQDYYKVDVALYRGAAPQQVAVPQDQYTVYGFVGAYGTRVFDKPMPGGRAVYVRAAEPKLPMQQVAVPPQTALVPMTEDEIFVMCEPYCDWNHQTNSFIAFARAIEAHHGIGAKP